MSQISTPSIDLARLKKAVEIAEEIEKLQSDLSALLGGQPAPVAVSAPAAKAEKAASQPVKTKGKRFMSAEARERIAAAQRARWAKTRGGAPAKSAAPASSPVKAKGKRELSPEAREKIAAAARRRWAAAKKK